MDYNSKKVLTSPSSFGQISKKPFDILINKGFQIINNPYGRKLTEDEVIELAKDCIGIVAGVEPITARVMDALPQLKCISRVGIGMDSVDIEYAKQKGIIVVNTPDGPTRAVAEMTLAMTFSLLRKIPQADANLKRGVWKKETGNLLFGKTVGIIGLGRIGKMVAETFLRIGNKVVGYDLYPDEKWATINGVEIKPFNDVIAQVDILTLHIPGNTNLTPLIGLKEFEKMKKDAFLINIARGGVIDEEALYNRLLNKKLGGAAVDVFANEPYNGQLCNLDNIVLTPHLGSYAREGKLQMEIDAVRNLINSTRN